MQKTIKKIQKISFVFDQNLLNYLKTNTEKIKNSERFYRQKNLKTDKRLQN